VSVLATQILAICLAKVQGFMTGAQRVTNLINPAQEGNGDRGRELVTAPNDRSLVDWLPDRPTD
jgi:hypothetical protein